MLPGTAERMEPLKEKKKKKREPVSTDPSAVDHKVSRNSAVPSAGSGKMSRAAKMRAVTRGDHQEQVKTALEKQQVFRFFIIILISMTFAKT